MKRMMRSCRSAALFVTAACMVAGGLTGCGSAQDQASPAPGAVIGTKAPTASISEPGNESRATPSAKQKLPKGASTAIPRDPLAPTTIAPVMRHGKKANPAIRAKGGPTNFDESVTYTDGVRLQVTKMTQGSVTGQGPGVFPGRAVTDFYVTVTNGTDRTLPLDAVVVTVTYGSPARLAHAVYDQNSSDFAGPVEPGQTSRAVYGFSVPSADRGHVTMTIDLDGAHQLAVFTGKVK